ncbi:serine protease [Dulcicalothrix desertica PCC 7102]|uniref:Serine protease n=1 Tax=Dulcicalothrix desertica PCC 7102 TaxID=232991 RepID=A0A3S1AH70_9CYAN|nr:trypsin-like peptidase domain-containing protein [Dulcicalothrix desertica]RUT00667.1 serine protease [Dulcicalothrix desertica PCC 7102]TWH49731.1 S1-C subfamily serine protease [Dulcicalothrix desertica PCC 7102]
MNRKKPSNSQNSTVAIKDTNLISMVSLLACASMVSAVFFSSYARYLTRNVLSPATTSTIPAKAIQEPVNKSNSFVLPNFDSKNFVAKVVEQVQPAVVEINVTKTVQTQALNASDLPIYQWFFGENPAPKSQEKVARRSGSGFVINPDGHIITNAHVVNNADRVTVSFVDGRTLEGKVLGLDSITDIAVVKIQGTNLPSVKLGSSDGIQIGEWAIAIGNPLGFQRTVSVGIVSGVNRSAKHLNISERHVGIIQTDAAINPGNSGGPLLDAKGRVIGVNTAFIPDAQNLGFAIPINTALKIARELISKGKAEHPYLGIEVKSNNNRNIFGIREQGVTILHVVPGSSSQKAGLQVKDIIKKINNQPVNTADEVLRLIESSNVGSSLHLQLQRKGRTLQSTVKLDSLPTSSQ